MLQEVSEFIGLQVYTKDGVFLGNVNNVVLDVECQRIDGLFITGTNPLLVEGSRSVRLAGSLVARYVGIGRRQFRLPFGGLLGFAPDIIELDEELGCLAGLVVVGAIDVCVPLVAVDRQRLGFFQLPQRDLRSDQT